MYHESKTQTLLFQLKSDWAWHQLQHHDANPRQRKIILGLQDHRETLCQVWNSSFIFKWFISAHWRRVGMAHLKSMSSNRLFVGLWSCFRFLSLIASCSLEYIEQENVWNWLLAEKRSTRRTHSVSHTMTFKLKFERNSSNVWFLLTLYEQQGFKMWKICNEWH